MPTRVLRKPKKYPYPILPVALPDTETIKRIRPYLLWEFLKVQALYRSEKVQELYMQGKQKGAPLLRERFALNWNDFNPPGFLFPKGEVLNPKVIDWDFHQTGILDLAKFKKDSPDLWDDGRWLNEAVFPAASPLLAIQFHGFVPTETIIKHLRPILEQRDMSPTKDDKRLWKQFRFIEATVPKTYLDYLRSYDLYHCQQLDPREIGRRIYPTHKKPTIMARTALKRAKIIIQQAEKWKWPPKI